MEINMNRLLLGLMILAGGESAWAEPAHYILLGKVRPYFELITPQPSGGVRVCYEKDGFAQACMEDKSMGIGAHASYPYWHDVGPSLKFTNFEDMRTHLLKYCHKYSGTACYYYPSSCIIDIPNTENLLKNVWVTGRYYKSDSVPEDDHQVDSFSCPWPSPSVDK